MKLIANSVFSLPDGNKSVPGNEIPYDEKKASEWINKGLAYLVEGDPSFVFEEENPENEEKPENGEKKPDEVKKTAPPRTPRNKIPNKKQVKK